MLQKQNLSFPLNATIDTKSDEFWTSENSFLTQENCRFQKVGAITKRPGLDGANTGLSTIVAAGLSPKRLISDSKQLFATGQASELGAVRYFNSRWEYVDTQNKATTPAQIKLKQTFGGDKYSQRTFTDYYGGMYAVGVEGSTGFSGGLLFVPITYLYDGSNYITCEPLTVDAAPGYASIPRCAFIEVSSVKYLIVSCLYLDDTAASFLKVAVYDMNGQILGETDTSLATYLGEPIICPSADRTKVYITMGVSSSSFRTYVWNQSGLVTSALVSGLATQFSGLQDIVDTGTEKAILATQSVGSYPVVYGLNSSLALSWTQAESNATLGLGTLASPSTLGASHGIGHNGTNYFYSFLSINNTGVTRCNMLTGTSAGFSLLNFDYNTQPISRPFYYNSNYYVVVKNRNEATFSTGGVAKVTADRFYYIASARYTNLDKSLRNMCGIGTVGNGVFSFCLQPITRQDFVGVNADSSSILSSALFTVDLNNSEYQYGSVCNLGGSLNYLDGLPSFYDGTNQLPMGFNYPAGCTVSTSTVGGSITAGTYSYKVYFEYLDNQGNIVRGEESNPVSQATTGATSSNTITVKLSDWVPARASVTLLRTTNAGTIYYIIQKKNVTDGSENVTFTDITPDSSISGDTIQSYTTGGVLENTPPPPAIHASVFNDRLWVVPADEEDKVYYSKKWLQGEVPAFSVFLFLQQASSIPGIQDKLRGSGPVGDKLILLRENSCYWVGGDGANELGADSTLTEPELIAQDIGCSEPRSIVPTPIGLMFKSVKGIYLIDGSLSAKYIGAGVESYNSEEIVDATIIPGQNCVCFATTGRILVYDYLLDKWSVDTVSSVQALAAWNSKLVVLKTDGTVAIQGSNYQDSFGAATNVVMKVATGWIKLSGLQDFSRIWRVLILGRYYSPHTLTAKVYYDYTTTSSETYTFTPSSGLYQFLCHLARQKCESVKIEIYDTGAGRSMDLTGLTLEVGIKRGAMKVPAARKA